ncbi:Mur ligase [Phyllosticta citrichinensis]|uniref:Dihydrofolate synthetase n=1 Tax=Phyllosticta citrichinensis TaxID=1130410 RepID=A0ABR1Y5V6_9PEZI
MIELGLARTTRLLANTPLPWKAIHVAGTNGKGSICATASAMLHRAGVSHGRFTSPHLVDRWDCININEEPVAESLFREIERLVQSRSEQEGIHASEFEVLTATAFEIFTRAGIHVGVIETGMGGRLDATNVLQSPLVTVIAKNGLDHQAFLGDTIEKIAAEKAGILKPGVPCVVAGTNPPSVLQVISERAKETLAGPIYQVEGVPSAPQSDSEYAKFLQARTHSPHELLNIGCAHKATCLALEALGRKPANELSLFYGLTDTVLPGRLQSIDLCPITGRSAPVLLDGAHNADSALALASRVGSLRQEGAGNVVWVLAVSRGKDVSEMFRPLLKDGDSLVAVEFGPVDGMPWVTPTPAADVVSAANQLAKLDEAVAAGPDVQRGLETGARIARSSAGDAPMVVAGSLYLVSDVMRLLRDKPAGQSKAST